MDRSKLVENPAWATHAIADAYEILEQRVPPQWMPQLDRVRPGPRGTLQGKFIEFGCGKFGCVFPTLSEDTVLKITTDRSEAEFAAGASSDLTMPIVTEYRMVMSLAARYEGRPIYLLWREAAFNVGELGASIGGKRGHEVEKTIHEQHEAAHAVLERVVAGRDARRELVAWRDAVQRMMQIPQLKFVATGMLRELADHGLFFGDVHGGNIGQVDRDGDEPWVVTDPGHVVMIDQIAGAFSLRDNPPNTHTAPIFAKTMSARMLRMLWDRGEMAMAEFMDRYHREYGDLDTPRRSTRKTEGNTMFRNNFGRFLQRKVSPLPHLKHYQVRVRYRDETKTILRSMWATDEDQVRRSVEYTPAGNTHPFFKVVTVQPWPSEEFFEVVAERPVTPDEHAAGVRGRTMLMWAGPTVQRWLDAMDAKEIDKAYATMESLAVETGRDDDAMWAKRLHNAVRTRAGMPTSNPSKRNPPKADADVFAEVRALVADPVEGSLEIVSDIAETRGVPLNTLLFEASRDNPAVSGRYIGPSRGQTFTGGGFVLPAVATRPGWRADEPVVAWTIRRHAWPREPERYWYEPAITVHVPYMTAGSLKEGKGPGGRTANQWGGHFGVRIIYGGGEATFNPIVPGFYDQALALDQAMMAVWGVVNQMPARRDASGPGGKPTWPMTWDDLVYTIVDTALESVTTDDDLSFYTTRGPGTPILGRYPSREMGILGAGELSAKTERSIELHMIEGIDQHYMQGIWHFEDGFFSAT